MKRTGEVVAFDATRIEAAIMKAVRANTKPDQMAAVTSTVQSVMRDVLAETCRRFQTIYPNIENLQDMVVKHLASNGLAEIARAYQRYREVRARARAEYGL